MLLQPEWTEMVAYGAEHGSVNLVLCGDITASECFHYLLEHVRVSRERAADSH